MKKEGAGSSCIKPKKHNFNAKLTDKKDGGPNSTPKLEKDTKDAQRAKELKLKINESEMVHDLKTQLK